MAQLVAKIKGRSGELVSIIEADDLFTFPELSPKPYSPDYKLEENECYFLENFSQKEFSNEFIDTQFASAGFVRITKDQYQRIKYLCYREGESFLFQKVNPSQMLKKKWLSISDSPSLQEEPIIIINQYADAKYEIENDKLYFLDISRIKSFFQGIERLYREATEGEVKEFLEHEIIGCDSSFGHNNINTLNRKRIFAVKEKLKSFTKDKLKKLQTYIKDYQTGIKIENNRFIVKSNKDLQNLIYGIEERYYTTDIHQEKRIANSVIPISSSES